MNSTVTLDESHFKTVAQKARALGTTPEQYLQALIDADSRSFDEILQPVSATLPGDQDSQPGGFHHGHFSGADWLNARRAKHLT